MIAEISTPLLMGPEEGRDLVKAKKVGMLRGCAGKRILHERAQDPAQPVVRGNIEANLGPRQNGGR